MPSDTSRSKAQTAGKKDNGYILMHRRVRDHWLWDPAEPRLFLWWSDILFEVNHTEATVRIGFDLIECRRGQSLNSLQTWAKRWRCDVSTVRRFFKSLEKDKMISVENLKKTTRLTVCNYDTYQDLRQAKQSPGNGQAIGQQSPDNTNKEGLTNEGKNGKEGANALPPKSFKDWTRAYLKAALAPFLGKYGKEMLNAFMDYWAEPDPNGKMKMQLQRTWNTAGRLRTWKRNEESWGHGGGKGKQLPLAGNNGQAIVVADEQARKTINA